MKSVGLKNEIIEHLSVVDGQRTRLWQTQESKGARPLRSILKPIPRTEKGIVLTRILNVADRQLDHKRPYRKPIIACNRCGQK